MKTLQLEGGGFPLTTKTLEQLRDMAEQIAHVVSQMAGNDKVIISGVEEQGTGLYSDGWVVIEGELLPFVGGALGTHIAVIEAVEQAQYLKDDDNNGIGDFVDAYFERYATFSDVATNNHLFEDFVRYESLYGGVLKSGEVIVNPFSNNITVTGDFTNAVFLVVDDQFDGFTHFKIEFEELLDEYHILITRQTSQNANIYLYQPYSFAVTLKGQTFIQLSTRPLNVSGQSIIEPQKYQISLIKK